MISDVDYMIRLMNHINSERENPLFALAFSGPDELRIYQESNELGAIVLDEQAFAGACTELAGCRCIVLTEEQVNSDGRVRGEATDRECDRAESKARDKTESAAPDELYFVFKYSRVRDIVSAILGYMDVQRTKAGRRIFKSYGVISPIGRCGKTSLAVSLCMSDEVRGGLYIGMEEYSPFQDGEDVISGMIYLAKQRSEDFIQYVEDHIVKHDEYSVLGYLRSYDDALFLTAEDMFWIQEKLEQWGRYTTVVWDIGPAVLKDLSVLEAYDELVMPMLRDEVSDGKIKAFEKMLERRELGKLVRRLRKIYVPDSAPGSLRLMGLIENELLRT